MEFLGRESVAYLGYCVAEPKSGSQEVGTRSNPNFMEGEVFRGEEGNGLTLRKFLVFLFEPLFQLF